MFWKKKSKVEPLENYSAIGVDLHSHLLPGIDDGAQTIADSINMIKGLIDLGYKKIITTPHSQADYFVNSNEKILNSLKELKDHLKIANINVEIEAAAEYFFDYEFLDRIKRKELLTFGNNYILFELSTISPPVNFEVVVFEMINMGYRPILAHPERYTYWHKNIDLFKSFIDKGLLLQINIHSLSGFMASNIRNFAEKLIQEDLVSFAGSDTHDINNISILRGLLSNEHICHLVRSGYLMNNLL